MGRANPSEYEYAAIVKWWSGYSFAYDFTVPEARRHFSDILKGLQRDFGVDGYKFDGADIWHYTLSSPTGCKFNKGLGYAYTCADMIGGGLLGDFEAKKYTIDHKIFIRSCQVHALMPMMQFSLAPWRVLTKEEMTICRDAANLHVEFVAYILSLAHYSSKTGEPIVRYMESEFPHQGLEMVRDQFMLGSDWLVAPIVSADDSREVRLPKGTWTDDLGQKHVGPNTLDLTNVPLGRIPRYRLCRRGMDM